MRIKYLLLFLAILNQNFRSSLESKTQGTKFTYPYREHSLVAAELEEDLEVHEVETEDGYILHIHRIRGNEGASPVFVLHGLILSSINWLLPGRHKALPYVLSDAGYDVWIGNFRGNTYCKKHKTLSVSSPKFWNFSLHEVGYYDIPASLNYISNVTSKEAMHFVGYSHGATTFSIFASTRPEIAKKRVKSMVAMAPGDYLYHSTSLALRLVTQETLLTFLVKAFGFNQFLPHFSILNFLAITVCHLGPLCAVPFFITDGPDTQQFNYTLQPDIYFNFPAGTSMKLAIHTGQQLHVNKFRQFNYGTEKNQAIYGSAEPPDYDLSKIDVPVAVIYGENDAVVVPADARHFYEQVPKKLGFFKVDWKYWDHFDVLWAINGPTVAYSKVVQIFKDVDNQ